jgi:hypothetical protein
MNHTINKGSHSRAKKTVIRAINQIMLKTIPTVATVFSCFGNSSTIFVKIIKIKICLLII